MMLKAAGAKVEGTGRGGKGAGKIYDFCKTCSCQIKIPRLCAPTKIHEIQVSRGPIGLGIWQCDACLEDTLMQRHKKFRGKKLPKITKSSAESLAAKVEFSKVGSRNTDPRFPEHTGYDIWKSVINHNGREFKIRLIDRRLGGICATNTYELYVNEFRIAITEDLTKRWIVEEISKLPEKREHYNPLLV